MKRDLWNVISFFWTSAYNNSTRDRSKIQGKKGLGDNLIRPSTSQLIVAYYSLWKFRTVVQFVGPIGGRGRFPPWIRLWAHYRLTFLDSEPHSVCVVANKPTLSPISSDWLAPSCVKSPSFANQRLTSSFNYRLPCTCLRISLSHLSLSLRISSSCLPLSSCRIFTGVASILTPNYHRPQDAVKTFTACFVVYTPNRLVRTTNVCTAWLITAWPTTGNRLIYLRNSERLGENEKFSSSVYTHAQLEILADCFYFTLVLELHRISILHLPFTWQGYQLVTLCHPGLTYIFNFWHSATLALSPERQSARMPEIKL